MRETLKNHPVTMVPQWWLDLSNQPDRKEVRQQLAREQHVQVQRLPAQVALQMGQRVLGRHRHCCLHACGEQTEEYSQLQGRCQSCCAGSLAEPCRLNPSGKVEDFPWNPSQV